MTDSYLYIILALLPLAATMVVLQKDPYHALVIRGILGAIAAMSYAILGAADVALTEALVGTMLAITLYAIAVRSSLVMRLGFLAPESETSPALEHLAEKFRPILRKYHLRLELVPYSNLQSLQRALTDREIHALCHQPVSQLPAADAAACPYTTILRVPRLYEILQAELPETITSLRYINVAADSPLSLTGINGASPKLEESQP